MWQKSTIRMRAHLTAEKMMFEVCPSGGHMEGAGYPLLPTDHTTND